jgi:lipopolysaccharide assembly outer membrane protein LptD (OstA)
MSYSLSKYFCASINAIAILFVILFAGGVYAQSLDSLQTSKIDTATVIAGDDTMKLISECSSREASFISNIMVLQGTDEKPARVNYGDMTLEAIKITQYGNDSLVAVGKRVEADTLPGGVAYIGEPVFKQAGDEPYTGSKMVYNLKTKKGTVWEGRTKFDGGFYYGENVTRVNADVLQIRDGYYTTCDDEDSPHFHFQSNKMKMEPRDKVVAKPVVLYFSDVPVFLLPFGMFPITGGRSSGFIMPSYGESGTEGRYLRGMGYYFAPNDYLDAKVLMDYYDKSGVFFRGDTRYSVKYKMNGSISGSITRKNFAGQELRRWDLRVNHSQTIDPTMKLTASGSFQSDKSYRRDFSLNRNQRATRRLYSNARLTKNWEGTSNSMTISASRDEDLDLGNVTEMLPSISFNRGMPTYLFGKGGGPGQKERFYNSFSFSYNSSMQNKRSKTRVHEDSLFTNQTSRELQHNLSFSSPQRILKHFAVNPSMSYVENWYNEAFVKSFDENNNLITDTENGFFARRTYRLGVSVNTKLYGMFNPNIGSLKSIRHVITPSVSYSYTPDFSEDRFGYYETISDTAGKELKYDRFKGTGSSKSKSLSFSLQNQFQAKTGEGENENKFDILSISTGTGYNFAAPENTQKLSVLSTSVRMQKFIDLQLSASHSFYEYNQNPIPGEPPKLLYDSSVPLKKRRFFRLTRMSLSTSFKLEGKGPVDEQQEEPDVFEDEFADPAMMSVDPQDRFEDENRFKTQAIPWSFNANLSYRDSRFNPEIIQKTFSATTNFSIKITENWDVKHKAHIDLMDREIISNDFTFYRDLHCWEMSFSWTPNNSSRSGFFIEIRVKDPKLRDLKIRKTEYGGSALGFIR